MRLRPLLASLSSAAGPTQSHLSLAHSLWRAAVKPGDVVVDATAGRGYDTEVLLGLAGREGMTYALDVDAEALAACAERCGATLGGDDVDECFSALEMSHASPPPGLAPRTARLVVFNLGFLPSKGRGAQRDPRADAVPTTTAETTVTALAAWALDAVQPGGAVSVAVYPGHSQGSREAAALRAFAASLSPSIWRATEHAAINHAQTAPFLLTLHRLFRAPPLTARAVALAVGR